MVQAFVEDSAAPIWMLVDTGASAMVLSESLYRQLMPDSRRPRLDGATVIGVNDGALDAFFTRIWRLRLAAQPNMVDTDDVPVLVIPETRLLQSLSREVGVEVQALVGATVLRRYLTTVDYQSSVLRFARYTDAATIGIHEFEGFGFQMQPNGVNWTVYEVYSNRDAYAKGIRRGDVIEQLGNMPLMGQSPAVVQMIVDSYHVGELVPVTFRNGQTVNTADILVEDLLPHLPPP